MSEKTSNPAGGASGQGGAVDKVPIASAFIMVK